MMDSTKNVSLVDEGSNGQPTPPCYAKAVTAQPIAFSEARKLAYEAWATVPPEITPISSSLPGLELLSMIDLVEIDQIIDPFEVAVSMATRKRYIVSDDQKRICYRVNEEATTSMLICCDRQREFTMHIKNMMGQDVLLAHRQFKHCMGCICCDCCSGCNQQIDISSQNRYLGSTIEVPLCPGNQLEIRDDTCSPVAVLTGPSCIPCNCKEACCKDIDFRIMTPDMATEIGSVTRKYLGCWTHYLTTADSFTVAFAKNVDVKLKALVLATIFLLDFRWFEVRRRNNRGGLIGVAIAASATAAHSNNYNSI